MAGATPTMAISPTPFTPSGFTCGSCSSSKITSMTGGASAWTGHGVFGKVGVRHPPVAGVDHRMLHQRHADAADHAADALAAGRLRVDDAARPVGADDPPHARLAKIRVDGDLDEHGPESMHGEALGRVARLVVDRGFDGLAEAAHGLHEIVGTTACERVLARPLAGGLHGAADTGHGERAAVDWRLGQSGVTKDELDPFDRQAKRLGRYLRHRRPGSRPHVARGTRHLGGAVGQETRPGGGGCVVHRVGGGRHAPADQPAAIAHRARLGVAPAPAEALGGGPVAFPRRAARERQLLELVLLRLVAQAQLDRVDVQRHRELVHGGFEREDAARLTRGAHVGRRVHVYGCYAVARGDVRARMQEPARVEERLREFLVRRGLLVSLVQDGGEAAVT